MFILSSTPSRLPQIDDLQRICLPAYTQRFLEALSKTGYAIVDPGKQLVWPSSCLFVCKNNCESWFIGISVSLRNDHKAHEVAWMAETTIAVVGNGINRFILLPMLTFIIECESRMCDQQFPFNTALIGIIFL